MLAHLRPALVSLILFTLITGVAYPLIVTGVAQAVFPRQANGSVIVDSQSKPVGSSLIGQNFDDPKYFWGRLSATSPVPYSPFAADASSGSSGSNYGPLNPALTDAAKGRIDALHAAEKSVGLPESQTKPPVDLVTASGSGLDPHISPAAAAYQIARVAKARGMDETSLRNIVAEHTEGRQLGILGEPRVNVLELNLALDQKSGPPPTTSDPQPVEPNLAPAATNK